MVADSTTLLTVPCRHVPQRVQRPAELDQATKTLLQRLLLDIVQEYDGKSSGKDGNSLRIGTSRIEGKGTASFIAPSVPSVHPDIELWFREVAHMHNVGCRPEKVAA